MGDRGRPDLPAAVEAGDDALSSLLERAHVWVEPYWNARHLERTLDWLLVLEPEAPEPMQLAALTHDMERHFPGGPVIDPATMPPGDETYCRTHSERSAQVVGDWLRIEGGSPVLIAEVQRLVRAHETGGDADENVVQAADSVSFLEVNPGLMAGWVTSGSVRPRACKGAADVHVRAHSARCSPRAGAASLRRGARRRRPRRGPVGMTFGCDWLAPRSLEEALALKAEHGEEATVLAGGTFLGILINQRLFAPACLLSLRRGPRPRRYRGQRRASPRRHGPAPRRRALGGGSRGLACSREHVRSRREPPGSQPGHRRRRAGGCRLRLRPAGDALRPRR